jgi:murein L,D-transpeptidase YafK
MNKIVSLFFTVMFFVILIINPLLAKEQISGNYIVIYAYKYTLYLYNSQNKVVKSYPIGIGLNGMGKTREGDKRTPLGEYKILWKASRFAKYDGGYLIQDGKAFCGPDNIFTTDPAIGYPEESLWKDGYGGDSAVVMCLNYPNASDKGKGYTGGCIEIHATLLGGIGECSSYGCIRMYPEDARELYKLVNVGTKVYIKE